MLCFAQDQPLLQGEATNHSRRPGPTATQPPCDGAVPGSGVSTLPTSEYFASSQNHSCLATQEGTGPPACVSLDEMVPLGVRVQRIVRLGGAVDDDMANLLVAQLLYLDSADQVKDITMYVNSPGGSVTAGMAVFDTMRHVRPDVSTCCLGLAASMGAFILASGQEVIMHAPHPCISMPSCAPPPY